MLARFEMLLPAQLVIDRMMLALPTDLTLVILREWLDKIRDIARLDSACAPSVRKSYLALLNDPACVLLFQVRLTAKADLESLVNWMNARMVKVEYLWVEKAALLECTKINPLCIATMKKFEIEGLSDEEFDLDPFFALLKMVPMLTALEMTHCIVGENYGEYLTLLSGQSHLPIQRLAIAHARKGDFTYLPLVLQTFAGTLNSVDLGWEDPGEASLAVLCEACKKIKTLNVSLKHISAEAVMRLFARRDYLPCLEILTFPDAAVLNDEILIGICGSHPSLKEMSNYQSDATTLACCATALSLCPHLTFLGIARLTIRVKKTGCEVTLFAHDNGLAEELPKIASNCSYPIVHFSGYVSELRKASVEAIASACGLNLRSLSIHPGTDVDPATMLLLASSCPFIENLEIVHKVKNRIMVTDEMIIGCAKQWRSLREVKIVAWAPYSDYGMGQFIELAGGQLVNLHVSCVTLTSGTLLAICTHCTNLVKLFIHSKLISMEDIFSVLVVPNHLPKLETFACKMFSRALAQAVAADDTIDDRWRRIVKQ